MGGGGRGARGTDRGVARPDQERGEATGAAARAESHGFTLTGGAGRLDYLDDAMDGYEWFEREFPQIKGYVSEIGFDPNSDAVAYCASHIGPDGLWETRLALTPYYNTYANGGEGNYYHELNDLDSLRATGAHEFTHALVMQIANNEVAGRYSGRSERSGALYDLFDNETIEHRVLDSAMRSIHARTGQSESDIRRQVSNYATTNYHETLAECIGDYFARGESAAPLSVAAYHALKNMLK